MRVTQDMLYSNFLSNINNVNTQLYNTQTQMATGKSINNLSDNPIALSQILTINDIQTRFTQYKSNINYASFLLSAQDTATQNISNLLQNAGSLIIQSANATNDTPSNTALAQQLSAVKAEIKNSANAMFGGSYLFSGFLTNTAPVQNVTQQVAIISQNENFQIATSKNFGDLNQLQSGTYTVRINNGMLSITDSNGNVLPISSDGIDRSSAGGDQLSNSVNVSNLLQTGGWFDTGRGVKIYIPQGASGSFTFSYSPGGANVYMGDSNNLSIAYSDGLTTPITINAKEMLYQQHQTLQSNNQLLNSSNDPATAQTKLLDLHLANALSNVALQTGQTTIVFSGTDHNGNIVSGSGFFVSSGATLSQVLDYITHLSTKEVLQNNKVLTLSNGSIASSNTTIGALTGNSSITIRGLTHSGQLTTISFSAGTTISAMLASIGRVFNVTATINHGIIQIADNKVGSSVLNISMQTKTSSLPVFGMFNSISHGITNAFLGTVSATIQHGQIVIQDLRGGSSQLNLSISVKGTTTAANIFGVFNTIQQGGGINVFDAFDNAQAAILGQSVNQISKTTGFSAGSTLIPTVSGYYTGNNSDTWTFSVSGTSSGISFSHTITITNSQNQNVGKITMGVVSGLSGLRFQITVLDSQNNTIASYSTNSISKSAIASFLNNTKIQLPDGVNLTLASQNITPLLKDGDSFSVNLTNMLQQSITNIQNSLSQVDANRSIIGAYEQRMQLAQTRIDNASLSNAQTLSNLQDANYAKVISDYQREITIMQALLQSFAKINQLSLFNYL